MFDLVKINLTRLFVSLFTLRISILSLVNGDCIYGGRNVQAKQPRSNDEYDKLCSNPSLRHDASTVPTAGMCTRL